MIYVTLKDNTELTYNTFEEILDYDKIIKLNCGHNFLARLPPLIGNLINLEELICSKNRLIELPNKVNRLSGCKLWRPESIGNLINLKVLCCYSNQLTSLPDSICNLINLKEFNCSSNQLTTLPESIGYLEYTN